MSNRHIHYVDRTGDVKVQTERFAIRYSTRPTLQNMYNVLSLKQTITGIPNVFSDERTHNLPGRFAIPLLATTAEGRAWVGLDQKDETPESLNLDFFGFAPTLHDFDYVTKASKEIEKAIADIVGPLGKTAGSKCEVEVGRARKRLPIPQRPITITGELVRAEMLDGYMYVAECTSGKHDNNLRGETPAQRLERVHGEFVYFDSRINKKSDVALVDKALVIQ